ncbi:MAG: hypothetical protein F6K47_28575 [Symploca sp. SIO2E6]|nr:hypothetical protein [Symploca sp. SIO2E6]
MYFYTAQSAVASSKRYLCNPFASLIIANSQATKAAFIEAGGRPEIKEVVYKGFEPEKYLTQESN